MSRGVLGRLSLRLAHEVLHRAEPVMGRLVHPQRLPWLGRLPAMPEVGSLRSPARPWAPVVGEAPGELRTQPGIGRLPDDEDRAARERPLHSFFALHADAVAVVSGHLWPALVSVAPRLVRSTQALVASRAEPVGARVEEDPAALSAALRSEATALGISAVGVTAYDPRYQFAEFRTGDEVGDRVIVCILEQNHDATRRIPSERSEQAALSTYAQLQDRLVGLTRWLHARGYTARAENYIGESMFIPYAVAAGLGQLGLNGQLLTPHAGSRCRINVIHTDAPLPFDEPVDYGLEGVCDRCQACVRRCPVGAIPAQRREHRGIVKAKLNTKRCLPIVTQAAGCSVCMKVCPVQAYGLPAVLEEYERSGEILGTHTDALEGYDWPLDGRHYPPGEKPHVPAAIVRPAGYAFDPDRVDPPSGHPVLG
ncbi:4Fe-4S dicluster domain-containing protein [Actinomycetospora sp. CA-084318]|uniref:4Fe-4S dicluster domain-containing protein n=1 Tax=Actinomycetospora sp. CA-084318 TaxID=3239892 RepID=UPI003D97BA7D